MGMRAAVGQIGNSHECLALDRLARSTDQRLGIFEVECADVLNIRLLVLCFDVLSTQCLPQAPFEARLARLGESDRCSERLLLIAACVFAVAGRCWYRRRRPHPSSTLAEWSCSSDGGWRC